MLELLSTQGGATMSHPSPQDHCRMLKQPLAWWSNLGMQFANANPGALWEKVDTVCVPIPPQCTWILLLAGASSPLISLH